MPTPTTKMRVLTAADVIARDLAVLDEGDLRSIPFTQFSDARVWAKVFMEYSKRYGPFNEGAMLGWFANAIMCGWDAHVRESKDGESEDT